jgi:hypothetical protein
MSAKMMLDKSIEVKALERPIQSCRGEMEKGFDLQSLPYISCIVPS